LKGKTFTVQGYGNVGYYLSKYIVEFGGVLVGVAEWDGSIYNPAGINPEDLFAYKKLKKGIKDYPHAKNYYPDESAIYQECDIFVPAAFE